MFGITLKYINVFSPVNAYCGESMAQYSETEFTADYPEELYRHQQRIFGACFEVLLLPFAAPFPP